jgi:anti-sigma regulatory factor (Ser/Thr protein kinase)
MTMTRSDTARLRLPATASSVPLARRAIGELCERLHLSPTQTSEVKLAVTEACTNVALHAYADRPEAGGLLEIEAGVDDGRLRVLVRDHGRGVAPRPDSPGLGLGMSLIAVLAETVEIRGGGSHAATEVVMRFRLEAAS